MIERELTGQPAGLRWGLAEPDPEREPDLDLDRETEGDAAEARAQAEQPKADANAATMLMPAVTDDAPAAKAEAPEPEAVKPEAVKADAVKAEPPKIEAPKIEGAKAEGAKAEPKEPEAESKPATEPVTEPVTERISAPEPDQPTAGEGDQDAPESLGIWARTMPSRPRHRLPAPPKTELETEAADRHGRHTDFEFWSKPSTPDPEPVQPEPEAKAEPAAAAEAAVKAAPEPEAAPAPAPEPKAKPATEPKPGEPGPRERFTPRLDFEFWGRAPSVPQPRTEPAPEPAPKPEPEPELKAEPAAKPEPAPAPAPEPKPAPRAVPRELKERIAKDFDFESWLKPAPEPASEAEPKPGPERTSGPEPGTASAPFSNERPAARHDPAPPVSDQDATQLLPVLKDMVNPWSDPRLAPISKPDEDADAASADSPAANVDADLGATRIVPHPRASASAPAEAPARAPRKPEPDSQGASTKEDPKDAGNWRQSIPYDETGVLIRPKGWSDDDIETALVEMGPLREALTAAQARIKLDEMREADARAAAPKHAVRDAITHRLRRLMHPGPRHGLLAAILLVQAGLSLRNTNSAFEDEGLYLYSGHLELAHLIDGTQIPDFPSYFSGAPVLYPVIGALADQVGGLFAARLLSLLFMLGATGLLYLTARRLFGVRSALCGAALFSSTPSAVFVGGLATYDAPALFLLALGGWIVVRWSDSRWPYYTMAAPLAVLAAATKYAALLFIPTIVVLAAVTAYIHRRRVEAVIRPMMLTVLVGALTYGALKLGGPTYVQGIGQTTTARAQGTTPTSQILEESARWGGVVFVAALIGALYYVLRPTRDDGAAPLSDRYGRIALALLLVGTALLAPMDQLRIHTDVSLHKHIGFGLLFAAPLAGYGLVRLVGEHWRRLQLGIGVWALAFAIGLDQSYALFTSWPDQRPLVAVLEKYQKPGAQYLIEDDEPVIYYTRGDTSAEPGQFNSTFDFQYTDAKGQFLLDTPAYEEAIRDGYFQVIALDENLTAPLDQVLVAELNSDTGYKQVAVVKEQAAQHNGSGLAEYRVWVKV